MGKVENELGDGRPRPVWNKRRTIMCKNVRPWFALAIVAMAAFWVATPSSALLVSDESSDVVQQANQPLECFADGWTEQLLEDAALELAGIKPCRPCRDREWCTCTYSGSGGGTRVSCDPCCYQQYSGEIICLD
jgi:hypothetical protein